MAHDPMGLRMHTFTEAVNLLANWFRDTDTFSHDHLEAPYAELNHRR
jgi:hypothetical protein